MTLLTCHHESPHMPLSCLVACFSGAKRKEAPIKAECTRAKKKPRESEFKGDTEELIMTTYSLTKKGVELLKKKGKIPPEPTSLEEHQARIKMLVEVASMAPAAKVEAIWNKLLGGETCTHKDLLEASRYRGADCCGYKNIMKQMQNMKLLDETMGEGKFKLSDKVLKFQPRRFKLLYAHFFALLGISCSIACSSLAMQACSKCVV
jgi:hypothetical protein